MRFGGFYRRVSAWEQPIQSDPVVRAVVAFDVVVAGAVLVRALDAPSWLYESGTWAATLVGLGIFLLGTTIAVENGFRGGRVAVSVLAVWLPLYGWQLNTRTDPWFVVGSMFWIAVGVGVVAAGWGFVATVFGRWIAWRRTGYEWAELTDDLSEHLVGSDPRRLARWGVLAAALWVGGVAVALPTDPPNGTFFLPVLPSMKLTYDFEGPLLWAAATLLTVAWIALAAAAGYRRDGALVAWVALFAGSHGAIATEAAIHTPDTAAVIYELERWAAHAVLLAVIAGTPGYAIGVAARRFVRRDWTLSRVGY